MLEKTKGIVLRSIKYGETSLITTIFTEQYGVQAYMMQGVRNPKAKQNRTGLLQPSILLNLVIYHNPQKNLQRIKEFQPSYLYLSLQEEVIKNSVALFSVELLLRLLPEQAPMPTLFYFAYTYFIAIDTAQVNTLGNFPLYFIINCSRILGYELMGNYCPQTPHLDLQEGGFSAQTPSYLSIVTDEDAFMLDKILRVDNIETIKLIHLNSAMRLRLIDWYILFLQKHTQHIGNIKSLAVLQAVLH